MVMNINAGRGTQVRFVRPGAGWSHDQEQAQKLIVGKVYTVHHTDVHSSSTSLYLIEFPGEKFNTVQFDGLGVVEWFSTSNPEHLKAYRVLCNKGVWPQGFIPDDTEFPNMWQILLGQKLANCWVNHMLASKEKDQTDEA